VGGRQQCKYYAGEVGSGVLFWKRSTNVFVYDYKDNIKNIKIKEETRSTLIIDRR